MHAIRLSRIISLYLLWMLGFLIFSVNAQLDDPIYAFFFGDLTMSIFDLPRHFQASYHRAKLRKIEVNRHSPVGATFNSHVQFMTSSADAPDFLELPYRWMVLQENGDIPALPSWLPNSTLAAQTLHSYAEEAWTVRTMFLSTWGRRTGFGVQYPDFKSHNQAILEGYQRYVEATSTPRNPTFLAPVGLVYETIYDDCVKAGMDPLSQDCLFSRLYAGEQNYPSMQGTYVAGLTLATAMTGYDPMRQKWLPDIDDYEFDPMEAEMIRSAVGRTILQTYHSGVIQYPWYEAWPTDAPTNSPSSAPSAVPSKAPSDKPSVIPSKAPSAVPSKIPSSKPSLLPSSLPSNEPSASLVPSAVPSITPSSTPSAFPSKTPSTEPSKIPSSIPSIIPSRAPSSSPSLVPSTKPSMLPSYLPSNSPSLAPSSDPSSVPSKAPTATPSNIPSVIPSAGPSRTPTATPSASVAPSAIPSNPPSPAPTISPSSLPSSAPSDQPSLFPSRHPSDIPSVVPSLLPSDIPSSTPSSQPTRVPSSAPSTSMLPSIHPTPAPSTSPSVVPSLVPSRPPTMTPTVSSAPSYLPSSRPSQSPSVSNAPSSFPSPNPSLAPSISNSPSSIPSQSPSTAVVSDRTETDNDAPFVFELGDGQATKNDARGDQTTSSLQEESGGSRNSMAFFALTTMTVILCAVM